MEKIKNPRKILVPAEREKLIPKSGGKEKAYGFHGRAPDESPQRNHIKESGLLMPKQKCYPPVPLTDIRISDPFWSRYLDLVKEVMLPYQ